MDSAMWRDSLGLPTARKRRGVTPLVTLQNFPGHNSAEIVHDRLFKEIRMHPGDPVDPMAADGRQVGHAHKTLAGFIDQRHPGEPGVVTRERCSNFIQKAS